MKLKLIAILIASSSSIYAAKGGEDNNTNCNGVGNPNSPCEETNNENQNMDIVLDNINNSSASAVGGSVYINESDRSHFSGKYKVENTPSLGHYAPDPTISCYKTGGVTLALPGFGGAASGGFVDEKCEMREMIRLGLAGDGRSREMANTVIQAELYEYINKPEVVKESSLEHFNHLSNLGQ